MGWDDLSVALGTGVESESAHTPHLGRSHSREEPGTVVSAQGEVLVTYEPEDIGVGQLVGEPGPRTRLPVTC